MKGKVPHGSNYRQERAKKIMKSGGYARGGCINEPGSCEPDDEPKGKKSGGPVSGAMPKKRLDKRRRYASGGGVDDVDPPKKKSKDGTTVNIVIAGKDGAPNSAPPLAPPMGAPPMPPPGAMPPPVGGPPMPPPGMRPPGAFKKGGAVKNPKYPIDAGAGGGQGRLEKAAAQKTSRGPRKGGGK